MTCADAGIDNTTAAAAPATMVIILFMGFLLAY
jgi:hypothetical protein